MRTIILNGQERNKYYLVNSMDHFVVRTRQNISFLNQDLKQYNYFQSIKDKIEEIGHFPEACVYVYRISDKVKGKIALRNEIRTRLKKEDSIRYAGRVLRFQGTDIYQIYTENLFIKFRDELDKSKCLEFFKQNELKVKLTLGFAKNAYFLGARDDIGQDIFKLATELLNHHDVKYCHPELVVKRKSLPRDFGEYYENTKYNTDWSLKKINAFDAWNHSRGKGVTICVIDDGIDEHHPAFAEKIHKAKDMLDKLNHKEASHKFGGEMHGTACASIACANDEKLMGVAPEAELMPIRSKGLGSVLESEAFVWAADQGADIISCSWGPPDGRIFNPNDDEIDYPIPDHTRLAIDYAADNGRKGKGSIVLFAAGNGREPMKFDGYASHPKVLAIGASNMQDEPTIYSDYGAPLFCSFPSGDYSIVPHQKLKKLYGIKVADRIGKNGYSASDYFDLFDGTSASCPGVAGVVALLLSLNPHLSRIEVKNLLIQSCINPKTQKSHDYSPEFGWGIINANLLLKNTIDPKNNYKMENQSSKLYAIHIGINNVDNNVYGGSYSPLLGCINDANQYAELTEIENVKKELLFDKQATRSAFFNKMKELASSTDPGDTVIITYAGHGGQVADTDGDEVDFKDETLVLYDGLLIDDEIKNCFYNFRVGVNVIWITDSCHSGSNSRNMAPKDLPDYDSVSSIRARYLPEKVLQQVFDDRKSYYQETLANLTFRGRDEEEIPYKANIITFAACEDDDYAMENNGHGVFTTAFIEACKKADFALSYLELFERIKTSMSNVKQTPVHEQFGPSPEQLWKSMFWKSSKKSSSSPTSPCEEENDSVETTRRKYLASSNKIIIESAKSNIEFDAFGSNRSGVGNTINIAQKEIDADDFGVQGRTSWDRAYRAYMALENKDDVDFVEPDVMSVINADPLDQIESRSGGKFLETYPNPEDSNSPEPFIWHLDDEHSQLRSAGLEVCGQEMAFRKRDPNRKYPLVVIIDTGKLEYHPTMPMYIDIDASTRFDDPIDTEAEGLGSKIEQQGHGQATMAILAGSYVDSSVTDGEYAGFFGAIPFANVVMLRISDTVALLNGKAFSRAVNYAVDILKCDVISMSMAGVPTRKMLKAVNKAYEAGVVMVTAGGNSWSKGPMRALPNTLMYPARFNRVIAATGVTLAQTPYINELNPMARNAGSLYMQTCYGPDDVMDTAMAAYTANISWGYKNKRGQYFVRTGGGTSSATPQIAAAAALYILKYQDYLDSAGIKGTWRRAEIVRQALFQSADKNHGYEKYFGQGKLKALALLKKDPVELNKNLDRVKRDRIGFSNLDDIIKMWFRSSRSGGEDNTEEIASMAAMEIAQLLRSVPELESFDGDSTLTIELIQALSQLEEASDFLKMLLSVELSRKKLGAKGRSSRSNEMYVAGNIDTDVGGFKIIAENLDCEIKKKTPNTLSKSLGCEAEFNIIIDDYEARDGGVSSLSIIEPEGEKHAVLVTEEDEDGIQRSSWSIPGLNRSENTTNNSRGKWNPLLVNESSRTIYFELPNANSRGLFKKVKKFIVRIYRTVKNKPLSDLEGLVTGTIDGGKVSWKKMTTARANSINKNDKILLLLHGTFTTTDQSFKDLLVNPEWVDFVKRNYNSKIIAFEMPTIGVGVNKNAIELNKQLKQFNLKRRKIDIIATSRGGLVARTAFGSSTKMVLSAGTHLGTPLASKDNIKDLIDRVTNMAQLVFGSVNPVLPTVLKVINKLIGKILDYPGILDQSVGSKFVNNLLGNPLTQNQLLLGNNFQPTLKMRKRIMDEAKDRAIFHRQSNDGVTTLVSAIGTNKPFGQHKHNVYMLDNPEVNHFSYFTDEGAVAEVIDFLK